MNQFCCYMYCSPACMSIACMHMYLHDEDFHLDVTFCPARSQIIKIRHFLPKSWSDHFAECALPRKILDDKRWRTDRCRANTHGNEPHIWSSDPRQPRGRGTTDKGWLLHGIQQQRKVCWAMRTITRTARSKAELGSGMIYIIDTQIPFYYDLIHLQTAW